MVTRKKILFISQGLGKSIGKQGLLLKSLLYLFSKSVIFYSENSYRPFASLLPNTPCFILNNSSPPPSISLESIRNIRLRALSEFDNSGVVHFCFLSRLQSEKKPLYIPQLVNALTLKGISCFAHIIGDGSCKAELINTSSALGLSSKIIFHGAVYDYQRILDITSLCLFVLHPGTIGLTTNTALHLQLPVITHSNFSLHMPEIVYLEEDYNAVFYNYLDQKHLLQTLLKLISNSERLHTLTHNCLKSSSELRDISSNSLATFCNAFQ